MDVEATADRPDGLDAPGSYARPLALDVRRRAPADGSDAQRRPEAADARHMASLKARPDASAAGEAPARAASKAAARRRKGV